MFGFSVYKCLVEWLIKKKMFSRVYGDLIFPGKAQKSEDLSIKMIIELFSRGLVLLEQQILRMDSFVFFPIQKNVWCRM